MSLHIVHAVRSDRFAGVEQLIRRLAIAQARAGNQVSVIGGAPDAMFDSLDRAGVSFTPASSTLDVIRALLTIDRSVDVVNTHMTAADGAATLVFGSKRHRPAWVSTRHFAQKRARLRPLGRLIEAHVDAEIAISRTVATTIGVTSTVVYPGVDPVAPPPSALRDRVVLMAQRLQPEKHTEIGLDAFACSGLASNGWTLAIAGDGPDMHSLVGRTRELGIEGSVAFLGFRDDIPALMAKSSMLLASCPFEHLGLTVLEAMAASLPPVAADAAGHTELLSGLDPRALFPPQDVPRASESLRALASNPTAREALAESARSRQVAQFSLSTQELKTGEVYHRAIEMRNR